MNSQKTAFRLGLDLDNVTLKYTDAIRRYTAEEFGVAPETLADPKFYSMFQSGWGFESEDHFRQVHAAAVLRGLYTQLEPMPGASEALWALSDSGVHIHIITSRFVVHGQHSRVIADTAQNLEDLNIPFRGITFEADKKQVNADLYIDDAPYNVEALRAAGKNVLVFDAPYNRHVDGPRANNWTEARDYVLAQMANA